MYLCMYLCMKIDVEIRVSNLKVWSAKFPVFYTIVIGYIATQPFSSQIYQFLFKIITGNTDAFNSVAIRTLDGENIARFVRFLPKESVGERCIRVELCGHSE